MSDKDWKLFRSRLPEWQERYMDKLCREYIAILIEDGNPSDRFWQLEKRINRDKHHVGVQARVSRSEMVPDILSLIDEKAITPEDLEGFSEELKERVSYRFEG